MGFEALLVIAVLLAAVVLFVTEALRSDLVALVVLGVLLLSGVLTPAEGFAGFANPATITVAAMFVLSAGLERTGAVAVLGARLVSIGHRSPALALAVMMLGTALVSAFINNTAAVAVLLPSVLHLARETRTSPSKLLIPLSYASLFGGVCTLIGTSTTILVSALAEQAGERPIGMFEMAPLGLLFFVIGTAYMLTVGRRLLPDRGAAADLAEEFDISEYVLEVRLGRDAPSVGRRLEDAPLVLEHDIDVLALTRGETSIDLPRPGTVLREGDVLRVRGDLEVLRRLEARRGVELRPRREWHDATLAEGDAALVEAVVAPSSVLEGRTLEEIGFRNRFGGTVLAIRHHDRLVHTGIADTPLEGGDALLVEVSTQRLPALRASREFVVVSEHGPLAPRPRRALRALAVVAGMVASAALGVVPIVVAAVGAAVLLVLLRCLTLEEAYGALEPRVIVLLGGILPLGTALERTGLASLAASALVESAGLLGPVAVIAVLYALTSGLTEVMSNNATAVLMVPLALGVAATLAVDPRPLLLAVAFGASASFMTPVGYQTNTLVYGPGAYRFADYLRVGTPLNLIFWALASLLIPVLWPL